jgi:hypothetical protein
MVQLQCGRERSSACIVAMQQLGTAINESYNSLSIRVASQPASGLSRIVIIEIRPRANGLKHTSWRTTQPRRWP